MKTAKIKRGNTGARHNSRGFSMIEVLVSLLLLAFGLLGFALLQTMNLRFAQSANYRTQATNLAYSLLDQMRANRLLAADYVAASSFAAADTVTCAGTLAEGSITIVQNAARWKCQVRTALGDGSSANVTYVPTTGDAAVDIRWGDERWNDKDKDGTVTGDESNQHFLVTTRL